MTNADKIRAMMDKKLAEFIFFQCVDRGGRMSILIKGMEMPKNCDDCFLGDFYCKMCQHIDGYRMTGGRPYDCPLVEQEVDE